jgi:hypothetical protein
MNPRVFFFRRCFLRQVSLSVAVAVLAAGSYAQTKPNKIERRDMKREAGAAPDGKVAADDAQSRAMSKLREQFEVSDDAEWEVIAARIAKVGELRRVVAGTAGFRGVVSLSDKSKRSGRSDSAHLEQDALRSAVRDKLPDAEIKQRLARMHDVHRENEAKLVRAQEELRAILTVRQEAVAVMAGLLPP